jgi:hypothetical protein
MASKTDGPRTHLIAEWDRIREYELTAAQSLADARAALVTAHDEDVREVAAAVRKDDPTPDTGTNEQTAHEDTLRFALATEGIALALSGVERDIALGVQSELGFQVSDNLLNVEPSVPGARPAGEVLWGRYEEAVEGVIRRRRQTDERREQLLAYDEALAKKQAQKLRWERAGNTPESFVADLDPAEEEALNPPGSHGMPRQLAATGAAA